MLELRTHPSPHPFVRKGLVSGRPKDLPATAIVQASAPDGTLLGDGFWNARSDIAWRRLTDGKVRFDGRALGASIDRAAELREALDVLEHADAWRAVHAEGDGLSGLIVDRYRDVLVIQLHSAGWLLVLDNLLDALHARFGTSHHRVVLDERTAELEGVRPREVVSDGCPTKLKVTEYGVRYHVDLSEGHKTGFFCDQRENRRRLTAFTEGRAVLDLCCYTGGFGLTAAAVGAAAEVTGVDLDEQAVAAAKANAKLNQVRAKHVHADAFDWLRQAAASQRTWDVVVLDPPKLVFGRGDGADGRRRYVDLNRLAMDVVTPGGLLVTCSCSGAVSRAEFTELVRSGARKAGRGAQVLAQHGAGEDHPVHLECPESEYLKTLWMRVS